ncbi:hypothetical protein Taro_006442, partial [Colocasia esculenta]|nr:hypothetical protein [Colocasia esculenta]
TAHLPLLPDIYHTHPRCHGLSSFIASEAAAAGCHGGRGCGAGRPVSQRRPDECGGGAAEVALLTPIAVVLGGSVPDPGKVAICSLPPLREVHPGLPEGSHGRALSAISSKMPSILLSHIPSLPFSLPPQPIEWRLSTAVPRSSAEAPRVQAMDVPSLEKSKSIIAVHEVRLDIISSCTNYGSEEKDVWPSRNQTHAPAELLGIEAESLHSIVGGHGNGKDGIWGHIEGLPKPVTGLYFSKKKERADNYSPGSGSFASLARCTGSQKGGCGSSPSTFILPLLLPRASSAASCPSAGVLLPVLQVFCAVTAMVTGK